MRDTRSHKRDRVKCGELVLEFLNRDPHYFRENRFIDKAKFNMGGRRVEKWLFKGKRPYDAILRVPNHGNKQNKIMVIGVIC